MSETTNELARQIADASDLQLKQVPVTSISPLRVSVEMSAGTLAVSGEVGWSYAIGDQVMALYHKKNPHPLIFPIT